MYQCETHKAKAKCICSKWIKLTYRSPTGILTECGAMCELPPSADSKSSDDESIEALTLNRRQFLPEKIELSFNFPNAAKLERGGKMRGLDLESSNFEGWEWRWNVVGQWKVVLGHASIFSVKVCDFGVSFCWSWWLWKWISREKKKVPLSEFCYLVHTRAEFWAFCWVFVRSDGL